MDLQSTGVITISVFIETTCKHLMGEIREIDVYTGLSAPSSPTPIQVDMRLIVDCFCL